MKIIREYFAGIPTIGVLSLSTENFALFPYFISDNTLKKCSEILKVPSIKLNIGNSSLIGSLSVGNSYGLILPELVTNEEIGLLKKFFKENDIDIIVEKINCKNTAFGNLIVTNDRGCIISSEIEKYLPKIEDILNVEGIVLDIANLQTVGSNAIITNKGAFLHPGTSDEDIEIIKDITKVECIGVGTANRGTMSVGACIIGNSKGAIVGGNTTGPELLRIEESLDLID